MTGWEAFRSLILRKVICKTVDTRKSLGSDLLLAILLRSLTHAPNPSALALHRASRTLSTHIPQLREVTLGRQENANDRNRYNNRRLSTTIIKECSDPHWVQHRSRSHSHDYAGNRGQRRLRRDTKSDACP